MEDSTEAQDKPLETLFTADAICDLANKFMRQEMYEDALELLDRGLRLYPDNLSIKIQLGRIRGAIREASQRLNRISPAAESVRRDHDSKSNLFLGLADLFQQREELAKAIESYKRSIQLNPNFYLPFLRLGTIYYKQKEYEIAIKFLARAKALNPFNEDICYYLSLSHFYTENYQEALVAMVDALILSGDLEKKETSPYQQKLQLLIEKFDGFDRGMRNKLIKERQNKFVDFYRTFNNEITERVQNLPVQNLTAVQDQPLLSLSQNEMTQLSTLKRFILFKNLDENTLLEISSYCKSLDVKKDGFVYKENQSISALYLVISGEISIVKETPYGDISLVQMHEGQFFADDDFYDQEKHRTSALCTSDSAQILAVDRSSLIQLFQNDKDITLHFYWYFWKNLSFQIRRANRFLQKFFSSQISSTTDDEEPESREREKEIKKRHARVAMEKKEAVLKSQGLEKAEISILTHYSDEEIYDSGEYVFREGSIGDKLYVVVEGRILISKKIDNVGEEALALLGKGDFFGEMALIDGGPRSADAKAQKNGTTVLVVKRETIREVLKMDADSACNFLNVLYRLLNRRLQEIREKIYQWKVMAGGF